MTQLLKKRFPSITSIDLESDGNTSFLRAARNGQLDKVLDHLKSNIDINTSNANGLNALHLASKDGHVEIVEELLKRGAVVDAATKKGNTALHIASLAGQEEVVKLLVLHGASVNVQSQNGFTPLYMAAQENHDNVVKYLLANGANQSLSTEDGFTPLAVAMQQGHDKVVTVLLENDTRGKVRLPALHIAAKKDDVKAAKLLLENEHNPDVTSKSGFTPLHIASHYGNQQIANLLIQKGADVNYAAKHNITPLHVAAKWGKSNMVGTLIENGATIESKTRDGLTPLHCAARSGHEQVVDTLLEKGAPISSKTKNGLAPLHMAAQGDHVDAARILLFHRAPVDEVTVDYLTALHVAAHCGHVRVAKLLLDRQADANARALNGFTPLHIACKKNRIKVVELLLKHGASIGATTESGLTPLHVASFMGCMNIVIYLLQHDASPDVPTVRGETPLHLAARANQTDIIRILLRNGAQVDARAREQQTPLHIASRLGNVDIVMLLLQHGAKVDHTTKDSYTALHIAAKEGQDEVAAVLIENGASLDAKTKKGFTPLHLASKYGHLKVAKLLLQKEAPVDSQGKNGVTPLHVASHYDHQSVALLLLDKGASPHATAKNGHTPLHTAARKNQMDIANTLLEYGANSNAESKAGFTPLHLSAQEGHSDMTSLLVEHKAETTHQAKNGLTPLHLCAQEDRVPTAEILVKNDADLNAATKASYTPLHVACHYGQVNMVKFLLANGAKVDATSSLGYTPLHQAAQQGHTNIVNVLLEHKADPDAITNAGQTPLDIANKLGYITVIETLKVVTNPEASSNSKVASDEKYKVVAPEAMHETYMSDSEEEGGEDTLLGDQTYRYLTADEMKSLGDDSLPIDVTRDERIDSNRMISSGDTISQHNIEDNLSPEHITKNYVEYIKKYKPDNVDINRHPINVGFLVSFLVDARGGAMRGCRHSGVRIIVPPRCAASPTRITCRYVRPQRTPHPPPLMEGEALASRVLELGPVGAKFLGPVIIEVPHFAALRGKEREIVILRSDNGESWKEHTVEATEDILNEVLHDSFDAEDLSQLEDVSSGRITRILTQDFPQYFAVVSRVRQEVHAIGPEGGMVSSTVVPQVQAVFPEGALTKKIKVGLQAQPIDPELTAKLLGHGVAVSPVVTVEPRRRKFHKAITLSMPAPRAHSQGMINQYSGSAPTLRLLCSITGGTTRAQWEDVTGSTPLTFVNDCVSFTTTVSARFWLMDCRNVTDATKMATELYKEAIHVPFMAKFVVFAKRIDPLEARLRVFCMTDDKEDKTLEHQEHFTEVAKSRDVEVLEGKPQYIEFAGNLVPITKSGEQLQFSFRAFRENRLPFSVRVKDQHAEAVSRCLFMKEPKVPKGEPPQQPICMLNIVLPDDIVSETIPLNQDLHEHRKNVLLSETFDYYRPDPRLADISNLLGDDWVELSTQLGLTPSEINVIKSEYPDSVAKQGQSMLRMWLSQSGNRAQTNILENALRKIGREDIIPQCLNIDHGQQVVRIRHEEKERRLTKDHKDTKEDIYKIHDKYSAEEKEVSTSDEEEHFKRSVTERRQKIEQRLSAERSIPASSQRVEIVQEITTIKRQSLVEDKIAEAEKQKEIITVPDTQKTSVLRTSIVETEPRDEDTIRDETTAHTIDEVTRTHRIDAGDVAQRFDDAKTAQKLLRKDEDPKSPKYSKTPPPSPADFLLQQQAATVQDWDASKESVGLSAAPKPATTLESTAAEGKPSDTTYLGSNEDVAQHIRSTPDLDPIAFKTLCEQTNALLQSEQSNQYNNTDKPTEDTDSPSKKKHKKNKFFKLFSSSQEDHKPETTEVKKQDKQDTSVAKPPEPLVVKEVHDLAFADGQPESNQDQLKKLTTDLIENERSFLGWADDQHNVVNQPDTPRKKKRNKIGKLFKIFSSSNEEKSVSREDLPKDTIPEIKREEISYTVDTNQTRNDTQSFLATEIQYHEDCFYRPTVKQEETTQVEEEIVKGVESALESKIDDQKAEDAKEDVKSPSKNKDKKKKKSFAGLFNIFGDKDKEAEAIVDDKESKDIKDEVIVKETIVETTEIKPEENITHIKDTSEFLTKEVELHEDVILKQQPEAIKEEVVLQLKAQEPEVVKEVVEVVKTVVEQLDFQTVKKDTSSFLDTEVKLHEDVMPKTPEKVPEEIVEEDPIKKEDVKSPSKSKDKKKKKSFGGLFNIFGDKHGEAIDVKDSKEIKDEVIVKETIVDTTESKPEEIVTHIKDTSEFLTKEVDLHEDVILKQQPEAIKEEVVVQLKAQEPEEVVEVVKTIVEPQICFQTVKNDTSSFLDTEVKLHEDVMPKKPEKVPEEIVEEDSKKKEDVKSPSKSKDKKKKKSFGGLFNIFGDKDKDGEAIVDDKDSKEIKDEVIIKETIVETTEFKPEEVVTHIKDTSEFLTKEVDLHEDVIFKPQPKAIKEEVVVQLKAQEPKVVKEVVEVVETVAEPQLDFQTVKNDTSSFLDTEVKLHEDVMPKKPEKVPEEIVDEDSKKKEDVKSPSKSKDKKKKKSFGGLFNIFGDKDKDAEEPVVVNEDVSKKIVVKETIVEEIKSPETHTKDTSSFLTKEVDLTEDVPSHLEPKQHTIEEPSVLQESVLIVETTPPIDLETLKKDTNAFLETEVSLYDDCIYKKSPRLDVDSDAVESGPEDANDTKDGKKKKKGKKLGKFFKMFSSSDDEKEPSAKKTEVKKEETTTTKTVIKETIVEQSPTESIKVDIVITEKMPPKDQEFVKIKTDTTQFLSQEVDQYDDCIYREEPKIPVVKPVVQIQEQIQSEVAKVVKEPQEVEVEVSKVEAIISEVVENLDKLKQDTSSFLETEVSLHEDCHYRKPQKVVDVDESDDVDSQVEDIQGKKIKKKKGKKLGKFFKMFSSSDDEREPSPKKDEKKKDDISKSVIKETIVEKSPTESVKIEATIPVEDLTKLKSDTSNFLGLEKDLYEDGEYQKPETIYTESVTQEVPESVVIVKETIVIPNVVDKEPETTDLDDTEDIEKVQKPEQIVEKPDVDSDDPQSLTEDGKKKKKGKKLGKFFKMFGSSDDEREPDVKKSEQKKVESTKTVIKETIVEKSPTEPEKPQRAEENKEEDLVKLRGLTSEFLIKEIDLHEDCIVKTTDKPEKIVVPAVVVPILAAAEEKIVQSKVTIKELEPVEQIIKASQDIVEKTPVITDLDESLTVTSSKVSEIDSDDVQSGTEDSKDGKKKKKGKKLGKFFKMFGSSDDEREPDSKKSEHKKVESTKTVIKETIVEKSPTEPEKPQVTEQDKKEDLIKLRGLTSEFLTKEIDLHEDCFVKTLDKPEEIIVPTVIVPILEAAEEKIVQSEVTIKELEPVEQIIKATQDIVNKTPIITDLDESITLTTSKVSEIDSDDVQSGTEDTKDDKKKKKSKKLGKFFKMFSSSDDEREADIKKSEHKKVESTKTVIKETIVEKSPTEPEKPQVSEQDKEEDLLKLRGLTSEFLSKEIDLHEDCIVKTPDKPEEKVVPAVVVPILEAVEEKIVQSEVTIKELEPVEQIIKASRDIADKTPVITDLDESLTVTSSKVSEIDSDDVQSGTEDTKDGKKKKKGKKLGKFFRMFGSSDDEREPDSKKSEPKKVESTKTVIKETIVEKSPSEPENLIKQIEEEISKTKQNTTAFLKQEVDIYHDVKPVIKSVEEKVAPSKMVTFEQDLEVKEPEVVEIDLQTSTLEQPELKRTITDLDDDESNIKVRQDTSSFLETEVSLHEDVIHKKPEAEVEDSDVGSGAEDHKDKKSKKKKGKKLGKFFKLFSASDDEGGPDAKKEDVIKEETTKTIIKETIVEQSPIEVEAKNLVEDIKNVPSDAQKSDLEQIALDVKLKSDTAGFLNQEVTVYEDGHYKKVDKEPQTVEELIVENVVKTIEETVTETKEKIAEAVEDKLKTDEPKDKKKKKKGPLGKLMKMFGSDDEREPDEKKTIDESIVKETIVEKSPIEAEAPVIVQSEEEQSNLKNLTSDFLNQEIEFHEDVIYRKADDTKGTIVIPIAKPAIQETVEVSITELQPLEQVIKVTEQALEKTTLEEPKTSDLNVTEVEKMDIDSDAVESGTEDTKDGKKKKKGKKLGKFFKMFGSSDDEREPDSKKSEHKKLESTKTVIKETIVEKSPTEPEKPQVAELDKEEDLVKLRGLTSEFLTKEVDLHEDCIVKTLDKPDEIIVPVIVVPILETTEEKIVQSEVTIKELEPVEQIIKASQDIVENTPVITNLDESITVTSSKVSEIDSDDVQSGTEDSKDGKKKKKGKKLGKFFKMFGSSDDEREPDIKKFEHKKVDSTKTVIKETIVEKSPTEPEKPQVAEQNKDGDLVKFRGLTSEFLTKEIDLHEDCIVKTIDKPEEIIVPAVVVPILEAAEEKIIQSEVTIKELEPVEQIIKASQDIVEKTPVITDLDKPITITSSKVSEIDSDDVQSGAEDTKDGKKKKKGKTLGKFFKMFGSSDDEREPDSKKTEHKKVESTKTVIKETIVEKSPTEPEKPQVAEEDKNEDLVKLRGLTSEFLTKEIDLHEDCIVKTSDKPDEIIVPAVVPILEATEEKIVQSEVTIKELEPIERIIKESQTVLEKTPVVTDLDETITIKSPKASEIDSDDVQSSTEEGKEKKKKKRGKKLGKFLKMFGSSDDEREPDSPKTNRKKKDKKIPVKETIEEKSPTQSEHLEQDFAKLKTDTSQFLNQEVDLYDDCIYRRQESEKVVDEIIKEAQDKIEEAQTEGIKIVKETIIIAQEKLEQNAVPEMNGHKEISPFKDEMKDAESFLQTEVSLHEDCHYKPTEKVDIDSDVGSTNDDKVDGKKKKKKGNKFGKFFKMFGSSDDEREPEAKKVEAQKDEISTSLVKETIVEKSPTESDKVLPTSDQEIKEDLVKIKEDTSTFLSQEVDKYDDCIYHKTSPEQMLLDIKEPEPEHVVAKEKPEESEVTKTEDFEKTKQDTSSFLNTEVTLHEDCHYKKTEKPIVELDPEPATDEPKDKKKKKKGNKIGKFFKMFGSSDDEREPEVNKIDQTKEESSKTIVQETIVEQSPTESVVTVMEGQKTEQPEDFERIRNDTANFLNLEIELYDDCIYTKNLETNPIIEEPEDQMTKTVTETVVITEIQEEPEQTQQTSSKVESETSTLVEDSKDKKKKKKGNKIGKFFKKFTTSDDEREAEPKTKETNKTEETLKSTTQESEKAELNEDYVKIKNDTSSFLNQELELYEDSIFKPEESEEIVDTIIKEAREKVEQSEKVKELREKSSEVVETVSESVSEKLTIITTTQEVLIRKGDQIEKVITTTEQKIENDNAPEIIQETVHEIVNGNLEPELLFKDAKIDTSSFLETEKALHEDCHYRKPQEEESKTLKAQDEKKTEVDSEAEDATDKKGKKKKGKKLGKLFKMFTSSDDERDVEPKIKDTKTTKQETIVETSPTEPTKDVKTEPQEQTIVLEESLKSIIVSTEHPQEVIKAETKEQTEQFKKDSAEFLNTEVSLYQDGDHKQEKTKKKGKLGKFFNKMFTPGDTKDTKEAKDSKDIKDTQDLKDIREEILKQADVQETLGALSEQDSVLNDELISEINKELEDIKKDTLEFLDREQTTYKEKILILKSKIDDADARALERSREVPEDFSNMLVDELEEQSAATAHDGDGRPKTGPHLDLLDLPPGDDIVYMGPVKLNENTSVNRAGIEVEVIPIMKSPKARKRRHRAAHSLRGSMPDLGRKKIYETIVEMRPSTFLQSDQSLDQLSSSWHCPDPQGRRPKSAQGHYARHCPDPCGSLPDLDSSIYRTVVAMNPETFLGDGTSRLGDAGDGPSGETQRAETEEGRQEYRVVDQHQLSDEMKQLLLELEKESKEAPQ